MVLLEGMHIWRRLSFQSFKILLVWEISCFGQNLKITLSMISHLTDVKATTSATFIPNFSSLSVKRIQFEQFFVFEVD